MPPSSFAQEPAAKPKVLVSPFGVEIFARLIDQIHLKPITSLDQVNREVPISKCVVIVLGNAKPLDTMATQPYGLTVDRLVDGGASLLVATDRYLNLRTGSGNVLILPMAMVNNHRERRFDNRELCPWIWYEPDSRSPLFRGLDDLPVASNCPAGFQDPPLDGRGLHPVAWLPPGTFPKGHALQRLVKNVGLSPPYALATPDEGRDRIVILAGHGVFMNCMTIRDDIGNRRFAENILGWLKGERTHVLFYHENLLRTNLKLPLVGAAPEMPFPPITLDIVERMLGAIQDDGLPQRLLDRGVSRADGLRFPLILATALLFLYGLKKLFGVRLHRPLPGTPYLLGVQSAPHRPLIAQRMLDVAKRRRFDEPARALAESWFREIAGIEPQGGGKIAYELRAGLPERHRLSKRIDEMWNLATGVERGRVDRGRLLAVAETLDDLGAALRRGELTIAPR